MLRLSSVCRKNPVVFKQGQGMFSHQLKRILNKKSLHKYNWDPLPMYDPRKLIHANRYIDHDTYEEKYDPHGAQQAHLVPDQRYYHIPVPEEYKDAYWWRDLQARRIQCPTDWVHFRMHTKDRQAYDFQDLAFRKKFQFSYEEVVSNAKDMRKFPTLPPAQCCVGAHLSRMWPKLNLDGGLNHHLTAAQERIVNEGVPGMYSPRPAHPTSVKSAGVGGAVSSSLPVRPSSGVLGDAGSLSSPHAFPHDVSLIEDGVMAISDPEMNAILAAKSRHAAAERSPSSELHSSIGGDGGSSPGSGPSSNKRRAAPLATLVGHQLARQSISPPMPEESSACSTASSSTEVSDATANGGLHVAIPYKPKSLSSVQRSESVPSAPSPSPHKSAFGSFIAEASESPTSVLSSAAIVVMTTEEIYVSGRPFPAYMKAYASRSSVTNISASPESTTTAGRSGSDVKGLASGAAAAVTTTTTGMFHQNPSQYVSAIASQGELVAIGDRTGHVMVMRQRAMSSVQRRALVDYIQHRDALEESLYESASFASRISATVPGSSRGGVDALGYVMNPFEFYVAEQAYVPEMDTLNSVEVCPVVTALAFLPQCGPTTYLLAANEKVPKLYKMMPVRESAKPFRAVDKIDTKTIGPLTASSRASTVAMKPVAQYALGHEYSIHSICPVAYSEQFVTADDATVLLWCTEYPDTFLDVYDMCASLEDGQTETIRAVRNFPHEPFLFFVTTSAGNVLVMDTRQTLRWDGQAALTFANPPREEDEPFSNVTNSICDCALSPSGQYIAGRDFMSICLWDIRKAGSGCPRTSPSSRRPSLAARGDESSECGVVRRWELHPHLREDFACLYQSNLLFEKFDVQFLSRQQVCTGGFNSTLYTIDVENASGDDANSDIRTFQLPRTEGIAGFRRTTVSAHRPCEDRIGTGQGLGSRLTLLSRPSMSMNGTCGMMVACGQTLMQVSYRGDRR